MGSRVRSWEDYKTECQMAAKPGITIEGFVPPWNGNQTKLVCKCSIHGEWNTSNIKNSRLGRAGCPKCSNVKMKSWEEELPYLEKFLTKGITILGYVEPWNGTLTKLKLQCEIHGEWDSTSISRLRYGCSCPQCKRGPKPWESYQGKCEAVAAPGITIKGFIGTWIGDRTKLRMHCEEHGEQTTTSVAAFLQGKSCTGCAIERRAKLCRKSDQDNVQDFKTSQIYKDGMTFTREETDRNSWIMTCPVCSKDEYVKAGLCSGVFRSNAARLRKGNYPCRCSIAYRWTKQQYEYRLKKECDNRGYRFIRIEGNHVNQKSMVVFECPLHGEQSSTSISNFFNGIGCAVCGHSNQNQRECYINLIGNTFEWQYFKFGISVDSAKRVRTQKQKAHLKLTQWYVWTFPTVEACRAAEREVIETLPCGVIPKKDMKDGYTETLEYRYIDQVIAIYEKHGGELPGKVSLKKPKKKKKTK